MKKKELQIIDMRFELKKTLSNEVANLSRLLEGLPDHERIKVIIKLMPYVYPRVEVVSSKSGEVESFDITRVP